MSQTNAEGERRDNVHLDVVIYLDECQIKPIFVKFYK